MNKTEQIENALKGLVGLNGKKRQVEIERTANLFYDYLKQFNYEFFYRNLVISFFEVGTKTTTRNRIVKELLRELQRDGRIAKGTQERQSKPFLRARELSCIDYGSYQTLMAKNGYEYVDFFKWEYNKETKTPKRVKVDSKPLGEQSQVDFDFSVLRQTKPRKNQVCLSNSEKSMVLCSSKNKVQVYNVM